MVTSKKPQPGDELSFALGKEGATRRKLANASGADARFFVAEMGGEIRREFV